MHDASNDSFKVLPNNTVSYCIVMENIAHYYQMKVV